MYKQWHLNGLVVTKKIKLQFQQNFYACMAYNIQEFPNNFWAWPIDNTRQQQWQN